MHFGIGYDSHKLVKGRKLILGGVDIPYNKGLLGHSDADALVHAIMDALLGAAGMGDIGRLFPDTDPRYKGISSLKLLFAIRDIFKKSRHKIINIDSVIILQAPKLAAYAHKMTQNISRALKIDANLVNIKFKTEEGMGFVGRGEGIKAIAVASIT